MKNKSEVLKEYKKSFNKPEKYQTLRLEIEVDKRDMLEGIKRQLCDIFHILNSLKEEQSCVKETK